MKRTKGVCVLCGIEFDLPPNSTNRKYCSHSCCKKAWKINNREKDLADRRKYNKKHYIKSKPIGRLCLVCHTKFSTNIHTPYQSFCSSECRSKWARMRNQDILKRQKKEERDRNKEYYRDSNDFYHNKIRFGGNRYLALERDNFKCMWCGKDRTEVRLVVHHKDGHGPKHITPNHNLGNLVTLCRSCHRKAHDILAT